jgi:hypothetical protein
MLFARPRHGKSELVSRRLPAYGMGRNPDWPVIATEASPPPPLSREERTREVPEIHRVRRRKKAAPRRR